MSIGKIARSIKSTIAGGRFITELQIPKDYVDYRKFFNNLELWRLNSPGYFISPARALQMECEQRIRCERNYINRTLIRCNGADRTGISVALGKKRKNSIKSPRLLSKGTLNPPNNTEGDTILLFLA